MTTLALAFVTEYPEIDQKTFDYVSAKVRPLHIILNYDNAFQRQYVVEWLERHDDDISG